MSHLPPPPSILRRPCAIFQVHAASWRHKGLIQYSRQRLDGLSQQQLEFNWAIDLNYVLELPSPGPFRVEADAVMDTDPSPEDDSSCSDVASSNDESCPPLPEFFWNRASVASPKHASFCSSKFDFLCGLGLLRPGAALRSSSSTSGSALAAPAWPYIFIKEIPTKNPKTLRKNLMR